MTTAFREPACWRVANQCPYLETASGRKLSCQAWFRCEITGDYIIRWQCQSLEKAELSFNTTTLSMCHNQSDSKQQPECPPPVICAEDHHRSYSTGSTSMSTEIAIVIGLAVFAFLALLLIVLSSCKYWSLKKRMRSQKRQPQRNNPGYYFPFPVHYHNFWSSGFQQHRHHGNKNVHLSRPHGNQYPDVYFSRPQESWRYFQHLMTPSDDSLSNRAEKRNGRQHTHPRQDRLNIDPSVATESFIYHQPVRPDSLDEFSEANRSWFYQHQQHPNHESDDLEDSRDFYHMHKGNMERTRTQEQHVARNYRNEYRYQIKSSADFVRGPLQLSSIPIPSFGSNGFEEDRQSRGSDPDMQAQEKHGRGHRAHRKLDSGSSHPAGHGHTAKTPNVQKCSSISSQVTHINHQYQTVTPNSVIVQAGGVMTSNSITVQAGVMTTSNSLTGQGSGVMTHNVAPMPAGVMTPKSLKQTSGLMTPTRKTSPDVINSHNFSNRFVRVGKNIYRPVLPRSPSGSSSVALSSISYNQADLSYDSFLNEHLKQLAKRGTASSSTLEARQKKDKKDAEHRY